VQFTVTVNGQCAGGNHVNLTLTAGVQTRQVTITRGDLQIDFSDIDAVRDYMIPLLRQRIKEAGATTPAQMRTAIESAPFYV